MASIAMVFVFILQCFFTSVIANTEKTIFLAPEPINIPLAHPTLSDLRLHTLTPTNGTLRTQLTAQFPSAELSQGTATWLILDNLTPNQRYEVRVCWPATQPTEFTLSTFPLSTVWDTPDLMASLHAYTTSLQQSHPPPPHHHNDKDSTTTKDHHSSILLLRILAAADYFTTDAALMAVPPPVDVDIILDPFLLNVLPRSLAGTACYVVVVAVVAYFVARGTVAWIPGLIAASRGEGGEGREKKRQ